MDCHLPVLDGYQATAAIRRNEKETGEHIPIIAMTAGVMRGDADKCLECGMDDFLSKPYTLDHLRQKLERWLLNSTVTLMQVSGRHSHGKQQLPLS